ncbi:hypothetical protein BSAF29S_03328 [Bacillus safensis subsp. safensis]
MSQIFRRKLKMVQSRMTSACCFERIQAAVRFMNGCINRRFHMRRMLASKPSTADEWFGYFLPSFPATGCRLCGRHKTAAARFLFKAANPEYTKGTDHHRRLLNDRSAWKTDRYTGFNGKSCNQLFLCSERYGR